MRLSTVVAFGIVVVIPIIAVFGPWLAPFPPLESNLGNVLQPPSAANLLGTDELGRDVLSRLIVATRVSVVAALYALTIAMAIGVPLGLIAGYRGGYWDQVVMRFNDALMSFPALILAITIVGMLGPSLRNSMFAVGIVFAPRFVRIVRSVSLGIRTQAYVDAAIVIGRTHAAILKTHIVPNAMPVIIVESTLVMALAILAEASLSFIGLGVQPPEGSWGTMLGRAFPHLNRSPSYVFAPGIVLVASVWAFNSLGDSLRDAMMPKR